jgi:hemolysin activation/secretion protein
MEQLALPELRGLVRYSDVERAAILAPCLRISAPSARLEACAAALTARLVADGYVNSRAYVDRSQPNALFIVEGILSEIRVNGQDTRLVERTRQQLASLQGQVLYLPSLERKLQELRLLRGVASVRGNLSRLGGDPANAAFSVTVEAAPSPWQGAFSLRNDGSNESGQARLLGALLKPDLLLDGDTLLLNGELDGTSDGEFGGLISSISYTLPLSESVSFTGALGYSRRNFIELPAPFDDLATRQYQFYGQFDWVLHNSLHQRWSLSAGLSYNRNATFFDGVPLNSGIDSADRLQAGFLQIGLNGSGRSGNLVWNANTSLLQGIAAFTPTNQLEELALVDQRPGEARALSGFLAASWTIAPSWQLNASTAGQISFSPLTSPMRFTVGSDAGLRGLPSQLISGDDGWLGSAEVAWTFWRNRRHTLQLVPFYGIGWVRTTFPDISFSDTVAAGGVFVRWLNGPNWDFELGWVEQFGTDDNAGSWQGWSLADGLYARVGFRF